MPLTYNTIPISIIMYDWEISLHRKSPIGKHRTRIRGQRNPNLSNFSPSDAPTILQNHIALPVVGGIEIEPHHHHRVIQIHIPSAIRQNT